MSAALKKYLALFQMSWKIKMHYKAEQLVSAVFLILVLFVFLNLWKTAFAAKALGSGGSLPQGYSIPELLWYLVFTESIVMSLPNVSFSMEEEVLMGTVALHLNRPYHYIFFHYAQFLGESLFRFLLIFMVGSLTACLLVGLPFFLNPLYFLFFPFLFLITHSLHFLYFAWIGLLAFWIEDIKGVYYIADRMKWILGGFFMPLSIFPLSVQKLASYLPFPDMLYGPAKLFLHFSLEELSLLLQRQLFWIFLLAFIVFLLFKFGTAKVQMNGG